MQIDLTRGPIVKNLLRFTWPLILGNIFQQMYNVVDTWVVGKFIGFDALGAVGASYTLMIFLTSIFIGLCMGSGGVFALYKGSMDSEKLSQSISTSFVFIGTITVIINIVVFIALDFIIDIFNVPNQLMSMTREYLGVVFCGMTGVFLYNFFANLLRSVGNSIVPLVVLGISSVINIVLDLYFVIVLKMGVTGVAIATVISQYFSALLIILYIFLNVPKLKITFKGFRFNREVFAKIRSMSFVTCIQQSVMNFGILLVQGLINSFGSIVMAAFAAAVKIDTLAYAPLQDFGNGFSTYIGQNYGANKPKRIRKGIKASFKMVALFSVAVSLIVFTFADKLMQIFVDAKETEIIAMGVSYLRVEGIFYIGIGTLFMLYGFYRAILMPQMSLVLTVISLGTRVILAYGLSSIESIGVFGIWVSVPIGWALADIVGYLYYRYLVRNKNENNWSNSGS